MAAEPRIYRWDDVGAPVASNVQDAFYEIAKSVLVDGYGSMPAAGWSMVYDNWSTDGIATFTNAAQSGVLGAVRGDSTSNPCALFIADAMVDAITAVNARSSYHAVTDLLALPSASDRTGILYSGKQYYWAAIANENVAVFLFANNSAYITASPTNVIWLYNDVFVCGAARSLRGLGSISAPSSGNFFMAGGWEGGYSNNGLHGLQGVILADQSGSITSDDRYGFNWPFSDSGGSFGKSNVDSIVELELRPVEIWTGATSSVADAYQQCQLPMLLSRPGLDYHLTDRISTQLLTELVSVSGKDCYVTVLPGNQRMLVSMALEDWI